MLITHSKAGKGVKTVGTFEIRIEKGVKTVGTFKIRTVRTHTTTHPSQQSHGVQRPTLMHPYHTDFEANPTSSFREK